MELSRKDIESKFTKKIEDISGQNIYDCYQCGKCSAGCPLTEHMDILPHAIMRWLMFGAEEKVLDANTFWFCSTCLQCSVKCPKGIDVARVMDSLRAVLRRKGKDRMDLSNISEDMWKKIPQQAIVSGFRKYSSY